MHCDVTPTTPRTRAPAEYSKPHDMGARDGMEEELERARDKGELEETDHAAARRLLWEVFARFGMGFGATTDGARLQGIVESTQVPPGLG